MKKLFALLLALCILCVSAAALAETAEVTVQAQKLEMDGFTLDLVSGEYYLTYDKVANQPYVMVYPFYEQGDSAHNYNFVWAGETFEMTVEDVEANLASLEQGIRSGIENQGVTMDAFMPEEPYYITLNGAEFVAIDFALQLSALGQSVIVYEREILLGSIGYIVTLSASSPENLDIMTQMLTQSLSF